MKKILFKFFVFAFTLSFLFTQQVSAYTCPNYEFKKDILKDTRDGDIKVLQEILNADKRTIIAYSGLGSKGQETTLFGKATRESLKRFQALFIEYIGVADGKFNTKTRLVMNSVCKGDFFTNGTGTPYDTKTTEKDIYGPIIGLGSLSTTTVNVPIRVFLSASEPIKTPNLTGVIISGGTASDVRKLASSTFSFLVTPNADVSDIITVQIEAGSMEDLAGNTNDNASNEWVIYIVDSGSTFVPPIPPGIESLIVSVPDIKIPDLGTTTGSGDCSKIISISVTDYANPCYGKTPFDYSGQGGGDSGSESGGITEILTQIAKGLLGSFGIKGFGTGGGTGVFSGGIGSIPGVCVCTPYTSPPGTLTGQPTILLTPTGGTSVPGRYLMTLNPGAGSYTGFTLPLPTGVCGQAIIPQKKGPPKCLNPMNDNMGAPVVGTIPSKPDFNWAN